MYRAPAAATARTIERAIYLPDAKTEFDGVDAEHAVLRTFFQEWQRDLRAYHPLRTIGPSTSSRSRRIASRATSTSTFQIGLGTCIRLLLATNHFNLRNGARMSAIFAPRQLGE